MLLHREKKRNSPRAGATIHVSCPRAVPMVEAMTALVLCDHALARKRSRWGSELVSLTREPGFLGWKCLRAHAGGFKERLFQCYSGRRLAVVSSDLPTETKRRSKAAAHS